MISNPTLCALQFAYEGHAFEENFATLSSLVSQTPDRGIVLAPELCLSGYSYDRMNEAAAFSRNMLPKLAKLSHSKTLGLTLIERKESCFFNTFHLFCDGHLVYTQAKAKLFALGDEMRYFHAGSLEDIRIVQIEGIKIAVLICFELRFPALWERIKGADVILVPAYWGKQRKDHFETLGSALAIADQSYVVCANSSDDSMAASSGIITPFGEAYRDDRKSVITHAFDRREIQTMRRYINIGLA